MTAIRELAPQLHKIAWSAAQGPGAADPWADAAGPREQRRAGSLRLLSVYSHLVKVLQRRIDLTINDALDAGSDYGEIATACGVSRQAIRQRWLRRAADSRWFEVRLSPRPGDQPGGQPRAHEAAAVTLVRLAGGPYDGARAMPSRGEVLKYEADSPPSESYSPVPLLAYYVPSQDDANVYVFAGVERDVWRMHTGRLLPPGGALAKKPRVFELAAEFGVESKVIMMKLSAMGEFIRSASSTVEHLAAYELRIHFAGQAKRKPPALG